MANRNSTALLRYWNRTKINELGDQIVTPEDLILLPREAERQFRQILDELHSLSSDLDALKTRFKRKPNAHESP